MTALNLCAYTFIKLAHEAHRNSQEFTQEGKTMKQYVIPLLLVLCLGPAAANAQPGHEDEGQMQPPRHHQMLEKLHLTDQQKQDIGKLRADFEKKMIAQRASIQSLRVDLRTAIAADNPDRAVIEKIARSISDIQAQGKMNLIDHLFAVRALLTPDQQKVWKGELVQLGDEIHGMARKHFRGGQGGMMERGSQ